MLTKERIRRHPIQIITDANYADEISLMSNTPAQAETLLHSLERPAPGIGHHVNADMTNKIKRSFYQAAAISILLYACTAWTLTKRMDKKLEGNYTKML